MYNLEKIWPKWNIVKTIGEGSFGKVFEISRNEYGVEEHSALKVISIPQSDSEVQSLKNDGMTEQDTTEYFKGIVNDFVQEIQLMSKLKGNSNIVAYEDFAVVEKTDGIGFEILIRMELLTGLPSYLRGSKFRVYDVIRLGIDMCKALEVCRELNIVHRDIKPDNIFVSSNGQFKLGDFGVARTIEKTAAGLSRKGTYSYMAPEIYNGNEYGFEADIYSLGIVLYKLLNFNRDPFLPAFPAPVKYNDKMEAMTKRIQGHDMPVPVNADANLARIIFKACAYNPFNRYSHPQLLRTDLEAIASYYCNIETEIFTVNGVNNYTNNSVFSSAPKQQMYAQGNSYSSNSPSVSQPAYPNVSVSVNSSVNNSRIPNQNNMVQQISYAKNANLLCPTCHSAIKQGDAFCGYCGRKLPVANERSVICPNCGFDMKPGVKFCGKCGFRL